MAASGDNGVGGAAKTPRARCAQGGSLARGTADEPETPSRPVEQRWYLPSHRFSNTIPMLRIMRGSGVWARVNAACELTMPSVRTAGGKEA